MDAISPFTIFTFSCQLYGQIKLSPEALKIINTKEFQRMKDLKQLALCHFIYPAATHTRYEHSLGVYHLTGRVLDRIQQLYPDREYQLNELSDSPVRLNPLLIECIKLAGLCHDIGHGPFSHAFDNIMLQNVQHPNRVHEVRSCKIVELLCRRELPELTERHINFITSLIHPQKQHHGALYQIIANHLNGVDVDKFDYLIRDSRGLGLTISFNPERLLNSFIIDRHGNIAYPQCYAIDLFEMFHSRYLMYKKVYAQAAVRSVESMMKDIFDAVDPIFRFTASIENMGEFCKLTDSTVISYIQMIIDPPPFLQPRLSAEQYNQVMIAEQLYQRLIKRDLYRVFAEATTDADLEEILSRQPNREEFIIIQSQFGFVTGAIDPFKQIFFYSSGDDSFILDRREISSLLGNELQETHRYLIYKG